jgi:hypothetical protein
LKYLHYKLSAAMLAIVVLLGAAFYQVDRYSVRLYYEELSQRLNASLAMYVANAETLISNGVVNREALTELSNRAMVINPTARILGHALPPDEIIVDQVDIAPIQDMLTEARALPIKGINPRNPGVHKVFSALRGPWRFPVRGCRRSSNRQ